MAGHRPGKHSGSRSASLSASASGSPSGSRSGHRSVALRPVKATPGQSLVTATVNALRRAILAATGPDVFLGSEEHLIAALGVSRPTFRQAARLLRHEQLLTIRRGVGGGFFTASPEGEAVAHLLAIHLNAQGTTLRQLNDVVGALQAEAVRALADQDDKPLRAQLGQYLEWLHSEQAPEAMRQPLRRIFAFETRLGELSGNPAIRLLIAAMRDVARGARADVPALTPQRIARHEEFQAALARAVQQGDWELAVLLSRRQNAEVRGWFDDQPLELA